MRDIDKSVAFGSPEFSDPQLNRLCRESDSLTAWRVALEKNTELVIGSVSGDFSFGLHLSNGRSCMAVDRFAIQSMCYKIVDGQLFFSQRADYLSNDLTEIDPQAIFDYLYFHVIPSPRTIYKDIFRIPPGHFAIFENGLLTVAPFWVPSFDSQQARSFGAQKERFLQILKESVSSQLDSHRPACFLSGGTDSSTVAGLAAMVSEYTTVAYSIGFDAPGYDEISFARLAAEHFKLEHHVYYITPDDLVCSIPKVASYFDQPFGNSSVLPSYYCAKIAGEDGVRKLLAGDGGDELFGGNSRYAKQTLFNHYNYVPQIFKKVLLEPFLESRLSRILSVTRKASSYVEQASTPMPERLQMYNLLMHLGNLTVLTPKFLEQIDIAAPLQLQQSVWNIAADATPLNKELAFDWRFTLSENDLRKVTGAAQMAGVNVGFPLLDKRLLTFSQALPDDYKLKGQKLRWFFKEALRGFLPNEILIKKKQGFGLPFGVWTASHSGLNKMANQALSSLGTRGIVRHEFIKTLLTQRLSEHPAYFGEMIWILMMLEMWLQAHAPKYKV